MKTLSIAFLSLFLVAQNASAEVIYKCIDGTRFFTVSQDSYGNLSGQYKGFSSAPGGYSVTQSRCERNGRGYSYRCVSTDNVYEYIVGRGASGNLMVWVNLNGGDDNGLHALYCK